LHSPAVIDEVIVNRLKTVGPIGYQGHSVARKHISLEPAVADLLQEQPIRCAAPVVLETIPDHLYATREHHGDAGAIASKDVPDVAAVVGEHEVEAVPKIFLADVSADRAVTHELEVDPVAMTTYPVVCNGDVVRLPEVYSVP